DVPQISGCFEGSLLDLQRLCVAVTDRRGAAGRLAGGEDDRVVQGGGRRGPAHDRKQRAEEDDAVVAVAPVEDEVAARGVEGGGGERVVTRLAVDRKGTCRGRREQAYSVVAHPGVDCEGGRGAA